MFEWRRNAAFSQQNDDSSSFQKLRVCNPEDLLFRSGADHHSGNRASGRSNMASWMSLNAPREADRGFKKQTWSGRLTTCVGAGRVRDVVKMPAERATKSTVSCGTLVLPILS